MPKAHICSRLSVYSYPPQENGSGLLPCAWDAQLGMAVPGGTILPGQGYDNPIFQGKCGCGKQLSFSETFTQEEPAVREPFPGCSLVRGFAAAPTVSALGKTYGKVIGSHRLLGLWG